MSIHLHEVRDTDTHFKIDPIDRTIANAKEVKNKLFSGDHESEIFTFELPRFIDGHDMSLCDVIQIHYLNQGSGNFSNPGIYEVEDLSVVSDSEEEELIAFSWVITRNVTQMAGSLSFAMHFACTEGGEEVYVWNTDIYTGITVKNTLSNSETIVESNVDILEQWREQLFGAGESALNKIETAKTEAIEDIKQSVKDEATIAVGEVVDKAVEDIRKSATESAASAATEAATGAAEEVKQLIQTAGLEQITAIGTAKDQATEAITQEKTQSIEDIKQSATSSATEAANKAATEAANSAKQSIQTAGQEQINAVQEIIDSIPEDYSDLYEMVEELDLTRAPGITLTESGERIHLADSSDQRFRGLRVYGKSRYIVDDENYPSPEYPKDILSAGQRLSTGKNLCSTTDLEVSASQTVTFEKVIPGGTYAISGVIKSSDIDSDTCLLMFYYSDGTTKEVEISRSSAEERKSTTTTFDKEVTKVRIYAGSNYNGSSGDTATFTDMQIEHGNTATEYEPYTGGVPGAIDGEGQIGVNITDDEELVQSKIFYISAPNGLPGIPVESGGNYTDESGQQWICDVKDYGSGKYTRHVEIKNAKDLTWRDAWHEVFPDSTGETHVFEVTSVAGSFSDMYALCNFFRWGNFANVDDGVNKFSTMQGGGGLGLRVSSDLASSLDDWNTFIEQNDIVFYFILKTPIITDIPGEEMSVYKELHTNYPNTDIFTNEEVQPGIEVDYTSDTKKYISERMVETAIAAIRSDLATVYEENYTWGFVEHMDILSPDNRIEYECLNRNYRPMSIDMSEHQTNYGSWGKFPSLVNNKPYMVKSSGEEDYLLDENDYTKKYDGTDSDVSNTEYDGGAFSKFIKVYVKRWIEGNDRHVRFSFIPIEGYTPCGFIDEDGQEMDHVWIPMFYGSTVDGKMRSLSGLQPDINQNTATQNTNIKAFSNRAAFFAGPIVETIRDMLFMLFKTTDIQDACGNGNRSGYVSEASPYYGVLPNAVVDGGQFYGTKDNKSLNKIFHSIVLGTYNQYQRDPYYLCVNGRFKVSTDYTFDLTGESYIDTGINSPTVDVTKWLYPYKSKVVDGFGSIPVEPMTASTSTGYCDGVYCPANKNFVAVVLRFGICYNGSVAGVSALGLDFSAGIAYWNISASVLLRPPVAA